jgi:N-acetyl-gamma-glutamyl-phosphate reductase
VNESLAPYNVGHVHRHVPEIEQELNAAHRSFSSGEQGGWPVSVIFSPHLLPISRGMLSMLYVTLTQQAAEQDWHGIYARRYEGEPFVRVLPKGHISTIAHAIHTNYEVISVHPVAGMPERLQIVSCIDNLVKGASGQALQNMNIMFGVDEGEGLR